MSMNAGEQGGADTRQLLKTLLRELFQAETSAARHCRREADRIEGAQPAHVLRAIATHAEHVLSELPKLAHQRGLPISVAGTALGALFSEARDKFGDLLIDSERSFRGTLLGCRHGVDLARLIHYATGETSDVELAEFIDAWLATRSVLVQNLEDELLWFAQHPREARKPARVPLAVLRRAS